MMKNMGALSVKIVRPSMDMESYFQAGPMSHDATAPPRKPPNYVTNKEKNEKEQQ